MNSMFGCEVKQFSPLSIPQPVGEKATKMKKDLIGKYLKVEVTDGRVFIGRFLSFDKSKNLILSGTVEVKRVLPLEKPFLSETLDSSPENKREQLKEVLACQREGIEKKKLGLVLVPGKHIVSVSVDNANEQTDFLGMSYPRHPSDRVDARVGGPDVSRLALEAS